jgi:hypothetical protein
MFKMATVGAQHDESDMWGTLSIYGNDKWIKDFGRKILKDVYNRETEFNDKINVDLRRRDVESVDWI